MSATSGLAASRDEGFVAKTVGVNESICDVTLEPHWMRPLSAKSLKTSPRKRERTDSLSQQLAPPISQRQKSQDSCDQEKLQSVSMHEASLGKADTQFNSTIGTKTNLAKEKSNPRRWTKQEVR